MFDATASQLVQHLTRAKDTRIDYAYLNHGAQWKKETRSGEDGNAFLCMQAERESTRIKTNWILCD